LVSISFPKNKKYGT
jgi:hypothetical protein